MIRSVKGNKALLLTKVTKEPAELAIFLELLMFEKVLTQQHFPLVEKLKETIKALTIKCVQLAEQGKKLKEKITRQEQQISRLTDKVMEQSDIIDRLQEKTADLGRLERYFGREQVQSIVGAV